MEKDGILDISVFYSINSFCHDTSSRSMQKGTTRTHIFIDLQILLINNILHFFKFQFFCTVMEPTG